MIKQEDKLERYIVLFKSYFMWKKSIGLLFRTSGIQRVFPATFGAGQITKITKMVSVCGARKSHSIHKHSENLIRAGHNTE